MSRRLHQADQRPDLLIRPAWSSLCCLQRDRHRVKRPCRRGQDLQVGRGLADLARGPAPRGVRGELTAAGAPHRPEHRKRALPARLVPVANRPCRYGARGIAGRNRLGAVHRVTQAQSIGDPGKPRYRRALGWAPGRRVPAATRSRPALAQSRARAACDLQRPVGPTLTTPKPLLAFGGRSRCKVTLRFPFLTGVNHGRWIIQRG